MGERMYQAGGKRSRIGRVHRRNQERLIFKGLSRMVEHVQRSDGIQPDPLHQQRLDLVGRSRVGGQRVVMISNSLNQAVVCRTGRPASVK